MGKETYYGAVREALTAGFGSSLTFKATHSDANPGNQFKHRCVWHRVPTAVLPKRSAP
jgi:hypothetical protein